MKKYIEPQISLCEFEFEDVITSSSSSSGPNAQAGALSGWFEGTVIGDIIGSGDFIDSWFRGE